MQESSVVAERWLPVLGHEGSYEVSDHGRVRSVDRTVTDKNGLRTRRFRGRMLKLRSDRKGYLRIQPGHRQGDLPVHVLVLFAFVGPRPPDMECCHNNGNQRDNRLENLRWDTRSSNMRDCIKHGTNPHSNRVRCPLKHLLAAPNLVIAMIAEGHRKCLACNRAGANQQVAQRDGQPFDFKTAADAHYGRILAGTAARASRDRTHCPRDHRLVAPNLVVAKANRGFRSCLACHRAHARAQHAKLRGNQFDFKAVADRSYEEIMQQH